MSINKGVRSFLFTKVLAADFANNLSKMLNNHPDRPEAEIILKCKTGDGDDDHITHNICAFMHLEGACEKIESKLLKIMTLQGYENITAEVEEIQPGKYLALINY